MAISGFGLPSFDGSSPRQTATIGSLLSQILPAGISGAPGPGQAGPSPEIQEILDARKDLKIGDLTVKNRILPVLQDPETRKLLIQNPQLQPGELNELRSMVQSAVKNPALSGAAYKSALQTLAERPDLKPAQIGQMLNDVTNAVGKTPENAGIALSMFRSAGDLLKTGRSPEDVGALAKAASAIGGTEKGSGLGVANAFDDAAKGLGQRPDLTPKQMAEMAQVIAARFPGKDPNERMRAFQSGVQLMGSSAAMDAKGIDAMLARGAAQGLKGEKLLQSFDSQKDAAKNGQQSLFALANPALKLNFDRNGKPSEPKNGQQVAVRPPTGRNAVQLFARGGMSPQG